MNDIQSSLYKNSDRLYAYETKIDTLSTNLNQLTNDILQETKQIKTIKEELLTTKQEVETELKEINEKIKTVYNIIIIQQIRNKFKNDIKLGEDRIKSNENEAAKLEEEIKSMHLKILEYDNNSLVKLLAYNRKKKEYEDLVQQYKITKESYDDALKRNEELKKDCDSKTIQISTLETQIEDMKAVIAKLTDARVILNKYFSTHFENFTDEEKILISEIEGNVFPGYYNNNPVLPDINQKNTMKALNNNQFFKNQNVNKQPSINDRYTKNENEIKNKNPTTILNEYIYFI